MNSPYNFERGIKIIGLLGAPAVFILLLILQPFDNLNIQAQRTIAVAFWMLIWWITEAVSISVTALLPIVLLPVLKVTNIFTASSPYASPIVFLFMGGFIIALAMEKWQLHRRIALNIVSLTGTNANGIIMGFMLAAATLSMWISNTAATVMMLPIATSVIHLLMKKAEGSEKQKNIFSLSIMIGIAYAANIGGIATIIGTPPNVAFAGFIEETYGMEISFKDWLMVGLPFSVLLLGIAYLLIVKIIYPNQLGNFSGSRELIRSEIDRLGKISFQEKAVLIVFFCTACLWIFRTFINHLIPSFEISDPGIAMMAAIMMFVIPSKKNTEKADNTFILVWKDTEKLPWGILLLFGGGLSLANAFRQTGLINTIGESAAAMGSGNTVWIIVLLIATILFMTEVMSNIALITVFLPVIAGIALAFDIDPLLVTIPVTMASSCAFMLPMSTPPNAIVFASGHIKIPQMVKVGLWLNMIAIIVLSVFSQSVVEWVFAG